MKKIKSIEVKVLNETIIYDENSFLPHKTTFKKRGNNIIMTEHLELKNGEILPLESMFDIDEDIKIERG